MGADFIRSSGAAKPLPPPDRISHDLHFLAPKEVDFAKPFQYNEGDCDAERMFRDAQLLTVAEGTSQICKVAISNRIYSMGNADTDSISEIL